MNTHPDHSPIELAEVPSEIRSRRAYVTPQLVDVGDVVELTQGGTGPYADVFGPSQRANPPG
jgi:hypothetical protein